MRSPVAGIAALIALFVVIIVGYSSVFTVTQTEQVLVVRLGEPVRVVTDPGLNFKAPFIDSVISIDKRILDLENPSQEVIASDQKRLVVDAFARYRIKDALRFYQSVGTIQAANLHLGLGMACTGMFELPVPPEPHEFAVANPYKIAADGHVEAPTAPGLGVEVDWERMEAATLATFTCEA